MRSWKFRVGAFLAGSLFTGMLCAQDKTEVQVVTEVPAASSGLYVANREPLQPSRLIKLPIGSITPKGWLRHQLELEANGMTGHLEEISPWCKFEGNAWVSPEGKGHSSWEEAPYWLKGYGDLGYVLKDEKIIKGARRWIDGVLSSQEADGYFGPRANKTGLEGHPDLWPHMVMLNVLQSFYDATGDERVLPFMTKYFKWLNEQPPETFKRGYWPNVRWGDTIETAYWLYNRTGDAFLLETAKKIHENMAKWADGIIDWHNVNIAQGFREPGVYYMQAKDPKFLAAAERNYDKVTGLYGQFPGGGFVGDENCFANHTDPRGGFETCVIVEFMHSFEMLTRISGNPVWADRCEDLAFNSLPAALSPDLKGLHYLTCPNQIQLDKKNKAPGVQNSGMMFSYSAGAYRCCQHNVSHGWPYYAEELWLATADKGLCASLYAASEVTAKVGDGVTVKIAEETDYPFGDTINLHVATEKAVNFALYLRIPRWCEKAALKINGKAVKMTAGPLSFAVIDRVWKNGDTVTLQLPMQLTARVWEKNNNAVSLNYGPLSFSLKIGEKWQKYGGSENWPDMEVYPTTPWNYGLVLDPKNPAQSIKLVRKTNPLPDQPFAPDSAPIELQAKAKKIEAWQADGQNMIGKLQASPVKSDEPVETVTLIPMGAARLRVSTIPQIGDGPDAHTWQAPTETPRASHGDNTLALDDGILPKNSGDETIPRFTWWDHKGTAEWVQYDFPKLRKISSCEVYWFEDNNNGSCRVPASWRVTWWDGNAWQPVADAGEYGLDKDKFNRVTFKPVETTKLRVEVQLQPNFSGGILEWQVKE